MQKEFKLKDEFIQRFANKKPNFGFNGLGEIVYLRTYSRIKANGQKEQWFETIQRVVEWVFETQRQHIERYNLGWNETKAQRSAEEMYERMFAMKFLPPGRGLWIAGTDVLKNKPVAAALNNCAFVSTEYMDKDPSEPFVFLMDMSMLGVGVGFDVRGAGKCIIQNPPRNGEMIIADSREGWVQALQAVIDAFLLPSKSLPYFDYSQIRAKGKPIKGFGGVASGPEPLRDLLHSIAKQFENRAGETVTITDIVDIMNKIGCCVVSGNVRRTAEIVFGDHDNEEYLGLKDYHWDSEKQCYVGVNSERAAWGWASNNTVFAELGMDYVPVAKKTEANGEPAFAWLQNMQEYSRMCEPKDFKDKKAKGGNPCLEQTLENKELCCLVETFPTRCSNIDDYLRTLKFAYLYAKTVTLCNTHWAETNRVMLRNRRIGTSMSGVAQIIDQYGIEKLRQLCIRGYSTIQIYDEIYSDWLCIPRSIKTTSEKPSGTTSLLAGVTPGIHFPESSTYIRRMRIASSSDMVEPLRNAGYPIEPAYEDTTGTLVVSVPVKVEGVRKLSEVSMWEQLNIAAFMQKYWADNQVSATITFDPKTESKDIAHALDYFQYQLKGVSFLPRCEQGIYHQMPYEEISEEQYNEMISKIRPIDWGDSKEEAVGERFCSNDSCTI